MTSNQMLEMARDIIELIILRAQIDIAEQGPQAHLFNRIRDLSTAVDLIDGCATVVSIMERT